MLQLTFETMVINKYIYKNIDMPWTSEDEYLLCGDINPKVNSDWPSTHSTKTFSLVTPQRGDLVTTSVKGGQQSPLIHTVLSEKQFEPRTSPSP